MAPNLFLAAKKVATPWTWYNSKKSKTNNPRKLYFSHEPVPGVYAMTPDEKRYLAALKPSGKKDEDHIFRELTSKEDIRLKSTERLKELAGISSLYGRLVGLIPGQKGDSRTRFNEDGSINLLQLAGPYSAVDYQSSEETLECNHNSFRTQNSSASSILSSTHAVRSLDFDTNNNITRHHEISPIVNQSRNQSCSSQRTVSTMSSTREVHSVAYILKNDGVLPHQNSPFGRKSRNESSHSLTNFGFHKHKYAIQGIEKVDLNGYKFLRQPLRIEYCQITKRWMFSSEIRTRKVIVPMCRDLNCMAKDMSLCGKTVDMELFCLDDAESWVVIGKGGRGHLSRRWEKHLGENGRLYCVDEKTECMRRQTVEEVKASRLRLEREKGKFGFFEEDASYMAVVRYLEKE